MSKPIDRIEIVPGRPILRPSWLRRASITMIEVIQGDITRLAVDAIINAANSTLLGGGPVHGNTIHKNTPYLLGYSHG